MTTNLDREHRRQRRGFGNPFDEPADVDRRLASPCCSRCRFWQPPLADSGDQFGICHRVVCVRQRLRSLEVGTLISLNELRMRHLPVAHEPMRTRAWAPACSLFTEELDHA